MNCSKFVEHVLRDHFKIEYTFPQSEGSLFNQSNQLKENIPLFAYPVETPVEGDMVVMHGARRLCHIGMFVPVGLKKCVLHSEARLKRAALHEIKNLHKYGYTLGGFYSWRR